MKNWIKENYKIILLVLGLTIIGPLIINILFKLHPIIDFFVAEWMRQQLCPITERYLLLYWQFLEFSLLYNIAKKVIRTM